MAKARAHPVELDVVVDLSLFAESLYELRERAEREGDRMTAFLAGDAIESVLALCDGIEQLRQTVPVRDLN